MIPVLSVKFSIGLRFFIQILSIKKHIKLSKFAVFSATLYATKAFQNSITNIMVIESQSAYMSL